MKRIPLPGTHLTLSRFSFGTASLHHLGALGKQLRHLRAALEAGFSHFDTAPLYGFGMAERALGRAFGDARSEAVTIATKVGLYPPGGARFELHLVTEQKPDPYNRITLSPTRADVFGQPLARIHWQVQEDDCRLFSQIAELALSQWAAGPLARLAALKARDREAIRRDLVAGGGIYHPAGTTRMGARAADSVVDTQLRVHGLDGLWAVATSVFPTVGGTSPSLGLMQLALRAADDIVGSVADELGITPKSR